MVMQLTGVRNRPPAVSSKRRTSIVIFSLFFAWVLAFPFEGQVLYSLAEGYSMDPGPLVFTAIAAHLAGLFFCGFLVKNAVSAKKAMLVSAVVCLAGSVVFFMPLTPAFQLLVGIVSFVAGFFVSSWGYYFRSATPPGERIKTAADVLIYSNILMIFINAVAVLLSAFVGLALCAAALAGVIILTWKLEPADEAEEIAPGRELGALSGPLMFLCLFITVITIDSGLMYEVINPAFAHLEALSSWYWAVPYIVALFIMRNLPGTVSRTYILFVGVAMIGFAFVFFMALDRSALSYMVVDTLMLGACGIFDLFWWSILGEMLDLCRNPARIFGMGLSANVLGVLLGGLAGSGIDKLTGGRVDSAIVALVVVFLVLMLLPLLNHSLSKVLQDHAYVTPLSGKEGEPGNGGLEARLESSGLTGREREIVLLLLKGRTYKMIAGELYLSENTVKTHLKNAYSKLGVNSKAALVRLFEKKT